MRRVVITGLGVVSPLGHTVSSTWQSVLSGESGAGPITLFDTTGFASNFACEVKNWDAAKYVDKRQAKHIDRFLGFAIAAGCMAMRDAGYTDLRIPEEQQNRWGVYVGSAMGGVRTIESTHSKVGSKGPRYGFSPYFITDIIANMAPGMLSMMTGAKGPNMSHVSACASGAHSIGEACRIIQLGECDAMIAGGADASIGVLGVGGFNSMRALSTNNEDPKSASRPFDRDRDGFVMAEGAGIIVLEERQRAMDRGAKIYAEVAGYAATADAHHITQPAPGGEGAVRCMRMALANAKLDATDILYINAHGTSTPVNDKNESAAIATVFGAHAKKLWVSSTKSMTGHMLGAAGSVEAALCALALQHQVAPPTINYTTADPACPLDYVANEPRKMTSPYAMSNSFGFGGTNATLIFSKES